MTAAPGMVERVAEAIHDAANREAGLDEYCSYAMAEVGARAAIEAIETGDYVIVKQEDWDRFAPADWSGDAALKGEG